MLETVEATAEVFTSHTADKNNPHNVTKEQVGLSNVDNTADMDKPVSNAVNSAINTFKEENSKEHTKIHSAINTLKDSNNAAYTALQQEINNAKSELQSAIKTKSDIGHNHDSVYIKAEQAARAYATKEELSSGLNSKANTSHSHTGYAASNHNHDSVYSKLNHTHTGIATTRLECQHIFTTLGITQSLTTQELVTKIGAKISSFAGTILTGWIHSTANIHITDAPADIIHLTITVIDGNGIYLEARAPFANNSLWIGSTNGGEFGGWKQVLNSTGQAMSLAVQDDTSPFGYCANVGVVAGTTSNEAGIEEPIVYLSMGGTMDAKAQLAVGTNTKSLYIRVVRGSGADSWRKI